MLFTRDFQNSRNSLVVILQYVPDVIGNMLIDKNNPNIISLGEVAECFFYLLEFGVCLDNEKVGGVGCAVSYTCEKESAYGILSELKFK